MLDLFELLLHILLKQEPIIVALGWIIGFCLQLHIDLFERNTEGLGGTAHTAQI